MVIFGVTASVSIGQLLIGGLFPGILMGIMLMIITMIIAKKENWPRQAKATMKDRWEGFKDAVWALLMPVLVVGGMLSGIFTPTEASVVAAIYAFLVGKFVYKKLSFKDIFPICKQVFRQTAQVTIIIAAAGVLGWLLTRAQVPAKMSQAILSMTTNKVIILLLINVILLVLGCFMETTAIVLLMTPVLLPIIKTIGMNPVHFGVFMVLNLCIGLITPPVGMCMYIGCGISHCSISDFVKKLPPFLLALIVALMVTVFFEPIVMFLPSLLFR
jgi:C4-dicarboxylate transporter DctM subunit